MGSVGRTETDNRLFIKAITWIGRSGAPWRDLPECLGLWNSVYRRFRRRVHPDGVHPDGVHPDGVKKGDPACEALGQSVGGWTTKIYAAVDALDNPLRILLSPGQCPDIAQTADLIADYPPKAFLADRGYDADRLLDELSSTNIQCSAAKKNRLEQRNMDENVYKDRNKIERYFNKLKPHRWVATRYDKTACRFAGFIYVASAMMVLL